MEKMGCAKSKGGEMGHSVKGLSGKKGGRIEYFFRGKEGQAMVFLSPASYRSAGSRSSLRMQPSLSRQGHRANFWR
jgi:hypothetical protein